MGQAGTAVDATSGVGVIVAMTVLSAIGEITRFKSAKGLVGYAGLGAGVHDSGKTHKDKHITKQGSPNARYAAVNLASFLVRTVPRYQHMYQSIRQRKPPRKGHFVALVAVARDFVTNVLYDMLTHHRPFFVEVEAYRKYRQQQLLSASPEPTAPSGQV